MVKSLPPSNVRNSILAGICIAGCVACWTWTSTVSADLRELKTSVDAMHREASNTDGKRDREIDQMQRAISRDIIVDEERIKRLEGCACLSK